MTTTPSELRDRQAELRRRYKEHPKSALTHKRVRSRPGDLRDPFHGSIVPENQADPAAPYGVAWSYGHDLAVGGLHDAPNPAELLCGALAACEEGLIRMMAGALGIELQALEVVVEGDVDVRGTLNIEPDVRVGFQSLSMTVRVEVAPGTPERLLQRLRIGAERLCVNLDTLRHGVPVDARYELTAPPG